MYSDNPLRDFEDEEAEHAAWLEQRPVCVECGEYIEDDHYYLIDGQVYCPDCISECRRVIC